MAETEYFAAPEIPEGAMLTEGIIVIGFTTLEGESGFKLGFIGDSYASTYIGLLEMAKHSILRTLPVISDADPE